MEKIFLGIDIGGTKLACALVTPGGRVLSRARAPLGRKPGAAKILDTLAELLPGLCRESGVPKKRLSGAGAGIPGILDRDRQRVLASPNLDIGGYAFAPALRKKLGIPVALENDVNVGLLGEQWMGSARNAANVIGLFPGTGIGGAIMIHGELYTGANGAASEIGHMLQRPGGRRCGCGNRGCLESVAGRLAVEREIKNALKQGKKSAIRQYLKNSKTVLKSGMLKKALAKNDRLVSNILRETARELGKACVSLRHVLDPEMILFGGGLVEACGDFLLPRIQKEIESDPFFSMLPPLRLATASLEDDAAVLGGAALIQKHLGLELRRVPDSPRVDLPGKETLAVDGEDRTSDCVIRADGTVRERNLKKAVKASGSIDRIGPGELAKILKGNPDVFFLGTGFRKKIGLTRAALAYLREREVEWKRLDTPGAARAYNRCDRRKAAFFRVTG